MVVARTGRPPGTSDSRERLIDACWSLLTEAAADGPPPTVAAICARAGCTPPTLYHHFGDLDTLHHESCRRAFTEWAEVIEAQVDTAHDPAERLRRRGHAYVSWGVAHPQAYRVLFIDPRPAASPDDGLGAGFVALMADVAELCGRTPDDPRVLEISLAHWAAVHGLTCIAVRETALPAEVRWSTLRLLGTALRTLGTDEH